MRAIPVVLFLAALLAPAAAHEAPGHAGRPPAELRELASRIVGGASLLVDLDRRGATQRLHDRAHRFEDLVRGRRDARELRPAWQALRAAFDDARRSTGGRDGRIAFLVVHLAEDLDEGDALLARLPAGPPAREERRKYAFVLTEECIGTNAIGKRPCPAPRRELAFRIPHRVASIHRIVGEWRDYGRDVKPQVLVDGQVVWTASAKSGWDTDGKRLHVPVRRGSVLSVRSSNGDPLWIRRLEIEYEDAGGHGH